MGSIAKAFARLEAGQADTALAGQFSPEDAIRRAVAAALGWTDFHYRRGRIGDLYGLPPAWRDPDATRRCCIPDYGRGYGNPGDDDVRRWARRQPSGIRRALVGRVEQLARERMGTIGRENAGHWVLWSERRDWAEALFWLIQKGWRA